MTPEQNKLVDAWRLTAWAVDWLRAHNASVRFQRDGTVAVGVGRIVRYRPTLMTAVIAVRDELALEVPR
jgi:hypothetical protein